jgi:riboflavin kinase/FMN adenylyltransferase
MRLVTSAEPISDKMRGAVIALGNFDGVHLGHQAVLQRARLIAEQYNAPVAVLTFDPHPRDFFGTRQIASQIASLDQKIEKLASFGVDYVFIQNFDAALAKTRSADFVDAFLVRRFGARHIVTGENYRFGRGRESDVTALCCLSKRYGVETTVVASAALAGNVFSSTAIREALRSGEPEKAAHLLGAPWELRRRVEESCWDHCISLGAYVRPAPGAYAVRVTAAGRSCAGIAQVYDPEKVNRHDLMRLQLAKPQMAEKGDVISVGVLSRLSAAEARGMGCVSRVSPVREAE